MESIQKKKGMSIGDMYPAVLTIVLVGMILGVGLFVLASVHDSVRSDFTGSQDSMNTSTGTTTLTDAALTNFYLSTVDTATNQTGTAITNYTLSTAGVLTWGTDIVADSDTDTVNVTYTYNYDATSSPELAITTAASGLATFADWIAIIVVVIAAAIVLGVVMGSFGRKRNSI